MKKLVSYPSHIFISPDLLNKPDIWLFNNSKNFSNIVIITDSNTKKLYAKKLFNILKKQGYKVILLDFPAGEKSKNYIIKQNLEEKMLKHSCDRSTLCLALGGGVVGDLAGFIAATYMRGIKYIHIPTTLLAMVDSSIGGKTGINLAQGKNLIGAFWQPKAIVMDLDCLKTLDYKQSKNGIMEILKIFLVCDKKYFLFFLKNKEKIVNMDKEIIQKLILRAVKLKCNIIKKDEKENNIRKILNFGHTIGHALESASNYDILHGEAVGLGMLVEAKISEDLGLLNNKDFDIIKNILLYFGISGEKLRKYDINNDIIIKKLIKKTKLDKKALNKQVNYILLTHIGQATQCIVQDSIVKQAIRSSIGAR